MEASDPQADTTLLFSLKRGEQEAFATFCSLILPQLRKRISRICRLYHFSDELADDFTHATIERVLESKSPATLTNLIAWMTMIARNLIVDTWRRERKQHLLTEHQLNELIDTQAHKDQELADEVMLLRECLSSLKKPDRIVLELIMSRPREEVAEELGISLDATHKRYRRALARLAKLMEVQTGPHEDD